MKYEFYGILPATFIYSFIFSFAFLFYFRNEKKSDCLIFGIAVIHLGIIFATPVIVLMALLNDDEAFKVRFIKDSHKCSLFIEIVSYINHGLNKVFYPFLIYYNESGFISPCFKIFPITFKGWFNFFIDLWVIPLAIILGIVFFIFKEQILDIYINFGTYFLNYLNILDLIFYYYEFGFSIWDCFRYLYRTFKCCQNGDEYKLYIKGKLIYHKNKISEELEKQLDELCVIANDYSQEIVNYKLQEVLDFIKNNRRNNYNLSPAYKTEHKKEKKIEGIKKYKLEALISEHYRKGKILERKIERLKNINDREVKGNNKAEICDCLIKCCSNKFIEIIKLLIFCLICIFLFFIDLAYFITNTESKLQELWEKDIDNFTNFSSDIFSDLSSDLISDIFSDSDFSSEDYLFQNDTTLINEKSLELESLVKQIFKFFYGYFIILPHLLILTGGYLIVILYAVVKRKFITGEYIYDRDFSNDFELILSVKKISSLIFASSYLGALCIVYLIEKDGENYRDSEEYKEFFQFYNLPHSLVVIILKFVFLLIMYFVTLLEYINFGCKEIAIADEGAVHLNKNGCCCCCCCCCIYYCFKCRREENIQLGSNGNFDGNNAIKETEEIKKTEEIKLPSIDIYIYPNLDTNTKI